MFDVCTTGEAAHIDTIFKFLPHTRQHGCIDRIDVCLVTRGAHIEILWLSKENFFSVPVGVKNSINAGPYYKYL
jgi:hypothetical protein